MKKIATIVGARPQFIKASAFSRCLAQPRFKDKLSEAVLHTGQHNDQNMSQVFFDELEVPAPVLHMGIAGLTHGAMTGRMLEATEAYLLEEKPDMVIVYGDTNSTLAGALAASKLDIPVAHVESGLRSYNRTMPEETNRVLTDHVSSLLFAPTDHSASILAKEGITKGVHVVGDIMVDVAYYYREKAAKHTGIAEKHSLKAGGYVLATCHRQENTDNPHRLKNILQALQDIARDMPVILPLHPRTKKEVAHHGFQSLLDGLIVTEPLSYLEIVSLEQSAHVLLTDSGGMQKEACIFNVPCITLRDETEWVETISSGWNHLAGADREKIYNLFAQAKKPAEALHVYGDGRAAEKIAECILQELYGNL